MDMLQATSCRRLCGWITLLGLPAAFGAAETPVPSNPHVASGVAQSPSTALPELLPRDLEIELAVSALPEAVRNGAAVYLLERGGYVQARSGGNGFTCVVRRSGAVPGRFSDSVLPICYDAEGSRTLLPAVFDEVRRLEQGESPQEVAAAIEAGWKNGVYTVPGPGVAYMLSPVFCLNGSCGQYVPHTMFYAPYKTDEDIGGNSDLFDHVPSLQAAGFPSAMIVLPVQGPARERILQQGEALLSRVKALLDF